MKRVRVFAAAFYCSSLVLHAGVGYKKDLEHILLQI